MITHTRLLSLLIAATFAFGCVAPEPTAPAGEAALSGAAVATPLPQASSSNDDDDSDDDDDGALLRCAPLAPASAEAAIGPAGGTLVIGPHRFSVPAGALDSTVVITARVQADSLVSVKFGPSGLTFATPARLELDTTHCTALPSTSLLVAHVDDAGTRVIESLSTNETPTGVWAGIEHFTRYAVAY